MITLSQIGGYAAIVIGIACALFLGVAIVRALTSPPPMPREYSPEAPAVPKDFRPVKPLPKRNTRPASDRLVRQVRAHARETHGLDQEGPRHG